MTMGQAASGRVPARGRRKATAVKSARGRAAGGRAVRRRASRDRALRAPRIPGPSFRSGGWRTAVVVAATALLLGWLSWYAATPEPLPTSDRTVNASGVVGTPLYIGMFTAPDGFDRTLRISGVQVRTTANADLTVTPLLCRHGTVGVTTGPDQFCADLVNPEGERLTAQDSIVLKVEAEEPVLAIIERIRIAYREDIRWGTQPAGNHQAIVSIAGRGEDG